MAYTLKHDDKGTRAFFVDHIRSVKVTSTPFTPKYRVEFTSVGHIPTQPMVTRTGSGLSGYSLRSRSTREEEVILLEQSTFLSVACARKYLPSPKTIQHSERIRIPGAWIVPGERDSLWGINNYEHSSRRIHCAESQRWRQKEVPTRWCEEIHPRSAGIFRDRPSLKAEMWVSSRYRQMVFKSWYFCWIQRRKIICWSGGKPAPSWHQCDQILVKKCDSHFWGDR